ncbi:alpha/beta-hydrolase [Penicillium angulare]|uniref:Alpha/beta-hydrolase n=1 Tax=Penicillium angulare TaxID=116970 RepID=A0A9W9K8H5_9EURO|nr:alpha/beta-hydrolase [Penicillium angulare]
MSSNPFFDLMNALSSLDVDKFQSFKILTTKYKKIEQNNVGILTDILIPYNLLKGPNNQKCPVIVRIHGGFLVTGSSRYAPWFSTWILEYALENNAIIVSPNYRLLPEANGKDILDDMNTFWDWLHAGGASQCLKEAGHLNIIPDIGRILLLGESAGGYLAIQLALSYPSLVRGVVAAYPMLDLKAPFYKESFSKPIVGVPNMPNMLIDEHIGFKSGPAPPTITAADPPERLKLAFSMVQNGRFLEFFGHDNPELFPMERVHNIAMSGKQKLPPIFIFHGEQDSAVPVDGSRQFVSLLRDVYPEGEIQFHVQDGDHGFDVDASLKTPWLANGLQMISKSWLKSPVDLSHL